MYDKYDALIFDMDGTLVDSGSLHEFAWTTSLEHFGIPIDRPFMRSLAGVPTKETAQILIEKFQTEGLATPSAINDYKEDVVRDCFTQHVKPTRLKHIAEQYQGIKPMAVGTGAYTEEATAVLKSCGLLDLMDFVVGADQVGNPKPAPDTFLRCAELMGVKAASCVVFEDAVLGLRAAEDAGMDAVDVALAFDVQNDYFL